MLCLSPQQLCRALFGFHRARCHDEDVASALKESLNSSGVLWGRSGNYMAVHGPLYAGTSLDLGVSGAAEEPGQT